MHASGSSSITPGAASLPERVGRGRADACRGGTPCTLLCPPCSPAPSAGAPSAVREDAPGRQHRLARLTEMQPLGDPVDKEVGDLKRSRRSSAMTWSYG